MVPFRQEKGGRMSKAKESNGKKPVDIGLRPDKTETEKALKVQEADMERALEACEYLTEGLGVRIACKKVDMDQGKLAKRYARARQARADARVESMEEILEAVKAGALEPNAARVILDSIKWIASRENQGRYGDKMDVTSGGSPIRAPVLMLAHDRPERQAD
jgi:hypothetical protein